MPCPKRKASRARRNKRSANKGLDVQTYTFCPNSGVPVMPHTVCLESGYYKGVKVIATKSDRKDKRSQKRQEIQARQAARSKDSQSSSHEATHAHDGKE